MSDDIPDACARCGDSVGDRPTYFDLKPEYRDYLEEERNLGWFPMGPVAVCCRECLVELDHLHEGLAELRAYGSDDQVDEVETRLTDELDRLDLDSVVDHGHFL